MPPVSAVPENVPDVTAYLLAWRNGDEGAAEFLISAVYDVLHQQAARAMRRESGQPTLQATALVNEAYLRLVDQRRVTWKNRAHFYGVASQLMRRILVDHARARLTDKRGGDQAMVTLTDSGLPDTPNEVSPLDLIALHDALETLAALDPAQARIIELRYFGGLTIEETAEVVGRSLTTVKADWRLARAWLRRALADA